MKRLFTDVWLGIVSLISPDPENERSPEEQREAQAVVFLMLCFIAAVCYAHYVDVLTF